MSIQRIAWLWKALFVFTCLFGLVVLGALIINPKLVGTSRDLFVAWQELRANPDSAFAHEQYAMSLTVFFRNRIVGSFVVSHLKKAVELDTKNKRMIRNLAYQVLIHTDLENASISIRKYVELTNEKDIFDLAQQVVLITVYLERVKHVKQAEQATWVSSIREASQKVIRDLTQNIEARNEHSENAADLILKIYAAFGDWDSGSTFIQAYESTWKQSPNWYLSLAQYYEKKQDLDGVISNCEIAQDLSKNAGGREQDMDYCVDKLKTLGTTTHRK